MTFDLSWLPQEMLKEEVEVLRAEVIKAKEKPVLGKVRRGYLLAHTSTGYIT